MRRPVAALVAVGCALIGAGMVWGWLQGANPSPRDRAIAAWGVESGGHIVAFGTSLTAGNGWPDRVQARLAACLGTDIALSRVAEPGQGSAWALIQVPRVVALAPDIVLIEFAINDADLRDGVSRAQSLAQHRALIAALRADLPDAVLVLMTMSPAYRMRGALRPFLPGHYADVAALAVDEDLGLIDLYPRWRSTDLPHPSDGLHPDDAATAQVIDPVLVQALAQGRSETCPP